MHTIAFYNLKGGVGKTSAAVNMAWHAARWKHRTVVWDLDPQGAATYLLGCFTMFGAYIFIAQYLQLVLGLSPLAAGIWTLPWALAFMRRLGALIRRVEHVDVRNGQSSAGKAGAGMVLDGLRPGANRVGARAVRDRGRWGAHGPLVSSSRLSRPSTTRSSGIIRMRMRGGCRAHPRARIRSSARRQEPP